MDEQIVKVPGRKKTTSKNSLGGGCCSFGGGHDSNWHCYHCFLILRWFLGLVILVIVFGLGIKIGELKAQLRIGHFERTEYGWYVMNHNYSKRMMINNDSFLRNVSSDTEAIATSSEVEN